MKIDEELNTTCTRNVDARVQQFNAALSDKVQCETKWSTVSRVQLNVHINKVKTFRLNQDYPISLHTHKHFVSSSVTLLN